MNFSYEQRDAWPPLAWVAVCSHESSSIRVMHGPQVETTPEWFCEAVWDGEYAQGGFDRTSLVAGSGARLREGLACFASSGSVVDRLHRLRRDQETWLSNTLPGLLAVTGGSVSPSYPHYLRDISTLVLGLDRYKRSVETSVGSVELVYFQNLQWDGAKMTLVQKPMEPEFASFTAYRAFLAEGLQASSANMASPERRHPYRMLATVSSGYDSPTVASLAREAGCEEGVTLTTARGGMSDSGEAIGDALGLRMIAIEREAWRRLETPEVPFICGDAAGEDVVLAPATPHLNQRVLLTGFQGDRVWDIANTHLEPDISRLDNSGLSLTEFRLWAGFIHLPLPFWGARRIARITEISNSSEMAPWILDNEGYERPISRRIIEGAGVPRGTFAVSKKAVTVNLRSEREFLTDESLRDYGQWLSDNRADWVRARRLPPITIPFVDLTLRRIVKRVANSANLLRRVARKVKFAPLERNRLVLYIISLGRQPLFTRPYVFAWALERAKQRYETPETRT